MTALGQLPFFVDFLKTSGLFDAFVADCPLRYVSPNAAKKRDVLGTAMLSMLSGHTRYAHITSLRCDPVAPELLGMKTIVSEDAVRRAFKAIDETEAAAWLRGHLAFCVEPLLAEPWILDVDTTIKPLYGHEARGGTGLQPEEARASEPLLPYLSDGLDASGSRCRRQPRRRACVETRRAEPVGAPRPSAARPHGRRCCAATAGSAMKGSCAGRRRGACPICSSCV